MKKLDLLQHIRTHDPYHKQQSIVTSLAWNTLKNSLENTGKPALFGAIRAIKVSPKCILITTNRPLINAEILQYQDKILQAFHQQEMFQKILQSPIIRFK